MSIQDDAVKFLKYLNIKEGTGTFNRIQDIAAYRDTLFILQDDGSTGGVYTLDIRPYRPMAKNTKATIYPVFATNGDTIPLERLLPRCAHAYLWAGIR